MCADFPTGIMVVSLTGELCPSREGPKGEKHLEHRGAENLNVHPLGWDLLKITNRN